MGAVTKYLGLQTINQILTFGLGLAIVRILSKPEYAYYSVTIGVLATITSLSDAGINSVILSRKLSRGGQASVQRLINQVLQYRLRLSITISAAGSMVLGAVLWTLKADLPSILGLVLATFVSFLPSSINSLRLVQLRKLRLIHAIQSATLTATCARLGLIFLLWVSQSSSAFSVILINFVGLVVATSLQRKIIGFSLTRENPGKNMKLALREATKRILPVSFLMILGEQLYLYLVAVQGGAEVVAESGALSRFAVAFTLANGLIADIVAPRFASMKGDSKHLTKYLSRTLFAYLSFVAIFSFFVCVFADPLIGLLGPNYTGLQSELVLFSVGFGLFYLGYAWDALNQVRAWTQAVWLYPSLLALWFSIVFLAETANTIQGSAISFLALGCTLVLTQLGRSAIGLRRER